MAGNRSRFCVVEAGPAKGGIAEKKTAGFDDVDPDVEAGGKEDQGPRVLRDVRLKEGEAHDANTISIGGDGEVRCAQGGMRKPQFSCDAVPLKGRRGPRQSGATPWKRP